MDNNAIKFDDYKENYKKEMIDGKIHLMAPGTLKHAMTIENINFEFKSYFKKKNIECKVFSEGLAVYLDEDDKTYVLPDIVILCDKSKFTEKGFKGAPSLVVEVLSPATLKYDRSIKFKKYEKAGVKEYWLVDYNSKTIEQYLLVDGKYDLFETVALLKEWEIDNMVEEERKEYKKIIKSSVFEDLEVNLESIFMEN